MPYFCTDRIGVINYYWSKNLNPGDEPLIKVIKTAIYGGNAAERAMRLTAETYEKEYLIAYKVITKDTYVDDIISGNHSEEERNSATELQLSLGKGGFSLKGFSFSGVILTPT